MQAAAEMQRGWDFAASIMGTEAAACAGRDYVGAVEEAIRELEKNINDHTHRNLGTEQYQGYMLEEWGAGTFNVDAAAAESQDRAHVLHSTEKNSPDIRVDSGDTYSAKSYADADKTMKAQAKFDPETRQAAYHGQKRLVPSDQLSDAKKSAHREADRNRISRPQVSDVYSETEDQLTDTIRNDENVHSRKVSREELEQIAKESKEQKFKAEEHGITADTAITTEYMLKQSLKAGYTAAAVTMALQLAPEIYKAIDYLIKTGEIDVSQLKNVGSKAISSGAESFLRGSTASILMIACEKGAFGAALQGISPTMLGAAAALVMQTVKNSILVAAGKMSARQMGSAFAETVIVSGSCMLASQMAASALTAGGTALATQIGGVIGQTIGFALPVIGYLLGSLVGASACALYNIGKQKLISFCATTGFTCFGLVEQNYEMPEEVLDEIGVEVIPIPRTQVDRIDIPTVQPFTSGIDRTSYETIDFTVLRRGIIGINKIGYVPS